MLIFPDEGGGTANPVTPPEGTPAEPVTPPAAPAEGLPPNDPNGEGTTPEEVAATLRSSGINLPPEPAPAAAGDEEEGDDPDNPVTPPEAAPVTPPEGEEEPEEPEEPEAPVTPPAEPELPTNAGDEKYAFEVTDANGTTFKIAPGATMEDILAEFEPKNNGQILDILNQLQKAEAAKAADDATEAENTSKQEQAQRVSEIRAGWKAEEQDLVAQKRIPEGKDGEARVKQVYQFMAEQNDARIKAGKPTIGSFEDALDKLEAQETRDKTATDAKAEKDAARENGGKVGGGSAPASGGGTPVYKGGARNAGEAIRQMGLIK